MKHSPVIAVAALVVLAASCGGSDVEPLTSEVEVTTTIDLLDGALLPTNSGSATTPDVGSTEPSDGESTTVPPDVATTDGGATPPTSATDGEATTGTTGTTQPSAGSAGDSTSTGTGVDDTGDAATELQPGQALIKIGGDSYPFDATTCEVAGDTADVIGDGTSSAGIAFEANIFFEIVDFDGDGIPDRLLEIFVDPEGPPGSDADVVPEFYASTLDVSGLGGNGDLEFEIVGQRITGTGTIVDFNGVAFAVDKPGPLVFDARCA